MHLVQVAGWLEISVCILLYKISLSVLINVDDGPVWGVKAVGCDACDLLIGRISRIFIIKHQARFFMLGFVLKLLKVTII